MAWDNLDLQRYFRNLMDEYRERNGAEAQQELRRGQAELARNGSSGVLLMRVAAAYAGKGLYEPSIETIERFRRTCDALSMVPTEADLDQLRAQIERQIEASEPHVSREIEHLYRRHADMSPVANIAQQAAGNAIREARRRIERWKLELRASDRREGGAAPPEPPDPVQPPASVRHAIWFLDPKNWRRHWKAILLSGAVLVIGSAYFWLPPVVEHWRPKIQVQAFTALRGRGAFVQFTSWPDGWRADSIDLAVYLRFTNADTRIRRIAGYELEVESADGWSRLDRVELVPPAILEFRALRSSEWGLGDFRKNNIDSQVRAHPIGAGESVEGWTFFTSTGGSEYLGSVRRWRFTFLDDLGSRSRVEGLLPDSTSRNMGIATLEVLSRDWIPPWRGGTIAPPDTSVGTISFRNLNLLL